jgi:hypothetical protein
MCLTAMSPETDHDPETDYDPEKDGDLPDPTDFLDPVSIFILFDLILVKGHNLLLF